MGLVLKMLTPIYAGAHCVQFPPAAFLLRPYRWLKLISDYGARLTSGPNFAYALCVNKITEEQKSSLNLSTLEIALNGAEPIRPNTLRRFAAAFAASGLRPEALKPGYGLAEATLFVSGSPNCHAGQPFTVALSKAALAQGRAEFAEDSTSMVEVVSTGPVGAAHQAMIVDPESLTLKAGREVGEIWLRGPSIAQGYWERPEETARTFGARLPGDQSLYLRTGDLGFIHLGELYVTGRIKEVMIFNGRNVYPQDIEATVEQVDRAFRANGCAVFSIDGEDSARLVIVQEVELRADPETTELTERIRAELTEQHETFDLAAILLVREGRIPRTTSGKIQRLQCKALFLANAIETLWAWR
jgi:acyl-CoA synthetase (AMP-forming)/AMP-acid ligase II